MFTKLIGMTVGLMISSMAFAQSLQLGMPAYGGTGCPSGTASASVSPDNSAVSILFDQYLTEAGSTNGRTIDRKSCNISVPVIVPQGWSVAIFQVDYRGFNAVPYGAYNRFDAEYFWAGSRGPRISRVMTGPTNDNFSFTDTLLATSLVWSPCGAQTNLRINTSMMSQTNRNMEQTMGSVDSADITSGLIYHLQWQRCM